LAGVHHPVHWLEGDGTGAFAANGAEQRKVVLMGHLTLLGNQPSQMALWQQAGKKGAALVVIKRRWTQR
jgi:hypothetical protein